MRLSRIQIPTMPSEKHELPGCLLGILHFVLFTLHFSLTLDFCASDQQSVEVEDEGFIDLGVRSDKGVGPSAARDRIVGL